MCESVLHDEETPVFNKYDLVNAGFTYHREVVEM